VGPCHGTDICEPGADERLFAPGLSFAPFIKIALVAGGSWIEALGLMVPSFQWMRIGGAG
jgi:hypothetical protein